MAKGSVYVLGRETPKSDDALTVMNCIIFSWPFRSFKLDLHVNTVLWGLAAIIVCVTLFIWVFSGRCFGVLLVCRFGFLEFKSIDRKSVV